jgi:hypothetical protein
MGICPLCNGFATSTTACTSCHGMMEDKGRIIDYFDDYSPYMEIEDMKKIDGYEQTQQGHECGHLLYCPVCNMEQVVLIKE